MSAEYKHLYLREAGSGTALLLIHGLLVNGDMFAPVFDTFARSYRVLAPDLRGHGQSKYLAPPYTVEQHARDLAMLLKSRSISSAIVLGYSQGGAVAQQLAIDYPDLVSRLILVCTFAYNQITPQEKLEAMLTPWLIRLLSTAQFARLTTRMMGHLTPEQSRLLETMIASNEKFRMLEAARGMRDFDSRARLGDVHCPTLIVAGANDTAVPLHHAQMLAQGISGAKFSVMPDAGHELVFTHPQELIDTVQVFLHGWNGRGSL